MTSALYHCQLVCYDDPYYSVKSYIIKKKRKEITAGLIASETNYNFVSKLKRRKGKTENHLNVCT